MDGDDRPARQSASPDQRFLLDTNLVVLLVGVVLVLLSRHWTRLASSTSTIGSCPDGAASKPGDIIVTLGVRRATRKAGSKDLSAYIGITEANLSQLASDVIKAVGFETLARICEYLDGKPVDIPKFQER